MPKGNPTAQTVATEKYQKKVGYMSKSFKLKSEVVKKFESACREAGVSQASKLTELMNEFSNKVNNGIK